MMSDSRFENKHPGKGTIDRGEGLTLSPERVDVREFGDFSNDVRIVSRAADQLLGDKGQATKLAAQC